MSQNLFATDTTPSLGDLDLNFIDLYELRELVSTPGYTAATPKLKIDGSGNFMVNTLTNGSLNNLGFTAEPVTGGIKTTWGHDTAADSGDPYGQFLRNGVVLGSITQVSSTGVAFNTTSDYRLKSSQTALTGSGVFIDALQPKRWLWPDGSPGVGFIAHEVAVVAPQSVSGAKDAVDAQGRPILQVMEYGSAEFIAHMVAELQALRARVAALEAA